jgi:hypothetical protein
VIRKLGIAVQIEIEGLDLRINGIDLSRWSAPRLGGPRCYGERDEEKQERFHVFPA